MGEISVARVPLKKRVLSLHARLTVNIKILKFYLLIVVGSPTADAATT